jgi:hypothetical protein
MRLTKARLIKSLRADFEKMGYFEIKDNITGANGLFIKQIGKEYFLSLGLTISNFYHSKFTASFYLSKTTMWSAVWGDIPVESYRRVSRFLADNERILYLDKEHNEKGVIDGWWNGDDKNEIEKFINVVNITENRFLQQDQLFGKIDRSEDAGRLYRNSQRVFEIMKDYNLGEFEYEFIPQENVDDIPTEWFKASEIALRENKGILNLNTVKSLAADAWRQGLVKLHSIKRKI